MQSHNALDRIPSTELDAAQLIGDMFDLLCAHPSGIHDQIILVVHFLLPCCPSANRFTKGLRVNGGSCGSPSDQWKMLVITGAFAIQFLDDVSAAAHKARRLLHQSFLSTLVLNVCLHQEPAHVSLC